MSEPTPPGTPSTAQVRQHLHTVATLLRDAPSLSAEAQQLLAELVEELSGALEAGTVPPAELAHLADQAAQLIRAANAGEELGPLGKIRDRLETAATSLEAQAPMVAGLTRRLIEALWELGI
jgi:hypothetical protein